jgi:hypothetical protein
MNLLPGCWFVVAPHFHLQADWSRRLLVGPGMEEVDGGFHARPSWRAPTDGELSLLVRAPDEPAPPEDLQASVCLFQLPGHLRSEWWKMLEQAAGVLGDSHLPGIDSFVGQVVAFLAFKDLPVPERACCSVVVSTPGQRSVNWSPEPPGPGGLRCGLMPSAPWSAAEEQRWPRLWAGINLGDEETSVVLINLPLQQLDAELHRQFPDRPASPAAASELAGQFLRSCLDYPTVRLILGPGEGCRLPRGGLILDGHATDKQEPDVLLLITYEGDRSI